MYDYLTLFKEFIEEKLNEKIAATEDKDDDYSSEKVQYKYIYELKGIDLSTTTYLLFNTLPYTPTVTDVGYYAVRREIPVEVAIQSKNRDFVFWILTQFEEILLKDGKGITPFADIDIIKLGEISFSFEEAINLYFPIYKFGLIVYFSEI